MSDMYNSAIGIFHLRIQWARSWPERLSPIMAGVVQVSDHAFRQVWYGHNI